VLAVSGTIAALLLSPGKNLLPKMAEKSTMDGFNNLPSISSFTPEKQKVESLRDDDGLTRWGGGGMKCLGDYLV